MFPRLNNSIHINWDLYTNLLMKQSPSSTVHEEEFAKWLIRYVHKKYGKAVYIQEDEAGNIYLTKGSSDLYPCVVAHIDINQNYHNNMKIVRNKQWVSAVDMDTGCQVGPGHDDKSGVYLCLEMLRLIDTIKVVFFREEEWGCIGSGECVPEFFSNCSMIIQQDRNAYKGPELITYTNGIEICSDEFVNAAGDLMRKYEYTTGTGTCTDVGAIKKNKEVNCVAMNLCAAYYDEHTDREVLSVPGFENCVNFAYELLTTLGGKKWEHISEDKWVSSGTGSYWDDYKHQWSMTRKEQYGDVYEKKGKKKDKKDWKYEDYVAEELDEWENGIDGKHKKMSVLDIAAKSEHIYLSVDSIDYLIVPYTDRDTSTWGVHVYDENNLGYMGKVEGVYLPKMDVIERNYQESIIKSYIARTVDRIELGIPIDDNDFEKDEDDGEWRNYSEAPI